MANENLYSIRTNCAVYSIDARRLTEEGKRFSVADDDKAAGGILGALQPFASLIDHVPDTCPRLLINMEKSGTGAGGLMFDKGANYRDVALLGDCDSGCTKLAGKLGWAQDLDDLMAESC